MPSFEEDKLTTLNGHPANKVHSPFADIDANLFLKASISCAARSSFENGVIHVGGALSGLFRVSGVVCHHKIPR